MTAVDELHRTTNRNVRSAMTVITRKHKSCLGANIVKCVGLDAVDLPQFRMFLLCLSSDLLQSDRVMAW